MRFTVLRHLSLLSVLLLPACATIVEGTNQTITVSTNPAGASCVLDRAGSRVGAIPMTPGSVRVDKSKNDLSVACSKTGYQTATAMQPARFGATTFGNIIAGGLIGVVVDAASGANFSYPSDVQLDLAAVPGAAPGPVMSRLYPNAWQEPTVVATPVAAVLTTTGAY